MGRSPIVALIMGIIPIVDLYLVYKWWQELAAAGGKKYDPIIYTILCCIPLVQLYPIYLLMQTAEDLAAKKKKTGYMFGVIPMFIISILIGIPALYVLYKTQVIINECE